MKKLSVLLLLSVMLFGCGSGKQEGYVNIDTQETLSKIANKNTFLLMIRNDDCYSCDALEEDLNPVVEKNNLTIYTLNYSDISEAEVDQLKIALGKYETWPVLFYVVDGEVSNLNKYEYSFHPEGWKTWLENMKIINK